MNIRPMMRIPEPLPRLLPAPRLARREHGWIEFPIVSFVLFALQSGGLDRTRVLVEFLTEEGSKLPGGA